MLVLGLVLVYTPSPQRLHPEGVTYVILMPSKGSYSLDSFAKLRDFNWQDVAKDRKSIAGNLLSWAMKRTAGSE